MIPPGDPTIPRGIAAFDPGCVEVHFDGACEPPRGGGVATFGFVVNGAGLYHEDCGLAVRPHVPHATNNVAEYVAAIRALEWLREQRYHGAVVMIGDSQLVVRQMLGEYRVRAEHLRAYHEWLERLTKEFSQVEFRWVAREENQHADALSKRALDDAAVDARRYQPFTQVPTADSDDVGDAGGRPEA
ncbi:MAG: ribonuclease HI [Thermoplasmata archaeon]|jgi:ribonuclease HI